MCVCVCMFLSLCLSERLNRIAISDSQLNKTRLTNKLQAVESHNISHTTHITQFKLKRIREVLKIKLSICVRTSVFQFNTENFKPKIKVANSTPKINQTI